MAFSRVDCDPGGAVEFSIDAVLGRELFNGQRVRVSGIYHGRVSG
jgi:hypothetical protein